MKLIFLGPQGCGKGTQAEIISKKLRICYIGAGELLRKAKGKQKKIIESFTLKGQLVPTEIVFNLIKEKLERKECKKGFILDGFPRNINQAKELDKITKIDKIIEIWISDEEAVRRLSSRLNCKKCGSIFNLITNPPKKKNICDKCGGKLYIREDDKPKAIKKRLKIYHKETEPLLKHYNSVRVNGEQPIPKVTEDILSELKVIINKEH
ncbi:MAG: nucleoside monophosphate kinase [Candidatus Pacearchaeota archaeon]